MELPNKGHHCMSLRLGFCPFKRSSFKFRGYKCILGIQKQVFGTTNSVCPLDGGEFYFVLY